MYKNMNLLELKRKMKVTTRDFAMYKYDNLNIDALAQLLHVIYNFEWYRNGKESPDTLQRKVAM